MPVVGRLERQSSSLREEVSEVSEAVTDSSGNAFYLDLSSKDIASVKSYRFEPLRGCVWVGHTNTDMDSIGSAIAGAYLFQGTAARASETLNGETMFVLNRFNCELPPLFKTLEESVRRRVCLVDHNQTTQMAEGVEQKYIKGVFDHHALQKNTVCTDAPIIVDIKPWGSCCTILARQFWKERKAIPPHVAGLLLAGILSDTLNLRSPTTTPVDKVMVSMLSRCAQLSEEAVNDLAMAMFKAKAEAFNDLSSYALIMGDHKVFSLADMDKDAIKLGFGVVETTHPEDILKRKDELLMELRAIRKEKHLHFSYLAIVDTLKLESVLLVCGESESELALLAFKDASKTVNHGVLHIGSRVSRKLDFIPALDAALQQHNVQLSQLARKQTEEEESKDFGVVVVEQHTAGGLAHKGSSCCMPTRKVPKLRSVVHGMNFAHRMQGLVNDTHANDEASQDGALADISSTFPRGRLHVSLALLASLALILGTSLASRKV